MNNSTIKERIEVINNIKILSDYFANVRDTLCAPYGLSSIQVVIVLDVFNNPNETKITDICKRLHKSTNTISPLINRLVSKGFLAKEQSKEDARVAYVSLTEKSKEITSSINVDIRDFVWPIFDQLSDEEFESIKKALNILARYTK